MMDRQEAVLKLIKVARITKGYAEDLYDSFFPKPVVPQYVANWYEEHKGDFDYELWDYFTSWDDQEDDDFKEWIREGENQPIIALINMHQFGYEVEKEKRYTVRVKGIDGYTTHLNCNLGNKVWFFASDEKSEGFRVEHTRKELEDAGFSWMFNCEGVEVKEVDDEHD